uniref:Uncharacterized protein n=1 Tax=mine drainage metagenome TaxID=410659 RepID=E6QQH6_9ZZZZ
MAERRYILPFLQNNTQKSDEIHMDQVNLQPITFKTVSHSRQFIVNFSRHPSWINDYYNKFNKFNQDIID